MNKSNIVIGIGLFVIMVAASLAAERLSRKLEAAKLKRDAAAAAAAAASAVANANPDTSA